MKTQVLQLAFTLLFISTTHAYYQTEQGRWLNRDPIGEYGGMNLYCAIENNSIDYIDVLGLQLGTGDYFGTPGKKEVGAIKRLCRGLNKVKDSQDRPCYDCQIETGIATKSQVSDALMDPGIHHKLIWGHGYPNRDRVFRSGNLNDLDMHQMALDSGTECKTFGCYADTAPKIKYGSLASYLRIIDELESFDTNKTCCEEQEVIRLYFGPKDGRN